MNKKIFMDLLKSIVFLGGFSCFSISESNFYLKKEKRVGFIRILNHS